MTPRATTVMTVNDKMKAATNPLKFGLLSRELIVTPDDVRGPDCLIARRTHSTRVDACRG